MMVMIRSFQGLRFVFISLIVFSHLVSGFDFGGDCGVAFFFMLSGFILSYVYSGKIISSNLTSVRLVVHQLKKFYPLYIVMLVAMLLINMAAGKSINILAVLADVLLLQSWYPANAVTFYLNGPAWFLSDIMFCYAVFVPFYKLIHQKSLGRLAVILISSLFVYFFINSLVPTDKVNDIIYTNPLLRLYDFVIGILLHRLYYSHPSISLQKRLSKNKALLLFIELFIIAFFLFIILLYHWLPDRIHSAVLFWPLMAVIIFFFLILEKQRDRYTVVTNILSLPLLVRLGGISMEMFLIQNFVITLLSSAVRHARIAYNEYSIAFIVSCYLLIIFFAFAAKKVSVSFFNKQL